MTTKSQYEQVITDVGFTLDSLHTLEASLIAAGLELDSRISLIENTLMEIDGAVQEKLDELAQQQVMANFLSEMKVVFDKYTAKIEIGSDETGYGEGYGLGETSSGIKFTAVLDGVTSTKEINKSVITSGDLV